MLTLTHVYWKSAKASYCTASIVESAYVVANEFLMRKKRIYILFFIYLFIKNIYKE